MVSLTDADLGDRTEDGDSRLVEENIALGTTLQINAPIGETGPRVDSKIRYNTAIDSLQINYPQSMANYDKLRTTWYNAQ